VGKAKDISCSLAQPGEAAIVGDLAAQLSSLPCGFAEIWVHIGDFPALMALVNDRQGWLMYLRYDGDAGFSSRNPGYRGDPEATISYLLSNGQLDHTPAAWSYPLQVVVDAVLHFARSGRVSDDIAWSNDSEDGIASPNDDAVGCVGPPDP